MIWLKGVFAGLLSVHLLMALLLARRRIQENATATSDITFIFPVFPFIVFFITRVRHRRPVAMATAFLQTILLILACIFGYHASIFSRSLISPLDIGMGLLAGHVIFGISLVVTHRLLGEVISHMTDLNPLWSYLTDNPRILMQFMTVSIVEELIYRVGAQPLLIQWTGEVWSGIILTAMVFALVHDHFFRNSVGQSIEFLGFSLLLGLLFFWTGSLILVIVVHAVRNIEISFIEYLSRADEAGETIAECEADYASGAGPLVLVTLPGVITPVACFQYLVGPAPTELAPSLVEQA